MIGRPERCSARAFAFLASGKRPIALGHYGSPPIEDLLLIPCFTKKIYIKSTAYQEHISWLSNNAFIDFASMPYDLKPSLIQLMRHAQSEANAGLATSDPAEIPLTEFGLQQAEALSRSIVVPPARIICSPFLRATQTALPIAKRFGMSIEIWPIQEFTYLSPARCAGTTAAQRRNWVERYWEDADPHSVDGLGAESFAQFIDRITTTLKLLGQYRGTEPLLVLGHGQFMQAIRWSLTHPGSATTSGQRDFHNFDKRCPIANCTGFTLIRSEGEWKLS